MKLGRILLEVLTEAGGRKQITKDFFVEFNEALQKDPGIKDNLQKIKDLRDLTQVDNIYEDMRKIAAKRFLDAVFIKLFGEAPKESITYKTRLTSDTVIATSSDGKIKAYISARRVEPKKGPKPFRVLPDYTIVEYTPEEETLLLWVPDGSSLKSKQYYSTIKRGVKDSDDPEKFVKYSEKRAKERKAVSNLDKKSISNKNILRTSGASSDKKIKDFIDAYNKEEIEDPVWDKMFNPYLQARKADPEDEQEHMDRVGDLLSDIVDWALDKDFITYKEADPSKEDIEIEGDRDAEEIKIVAKQGNVIVTTYLNTKNHKINRNKTKVIIAGVPLL